MRRQVARSIASVVLVILFFGCNGGESRKPDGKIQVVATTGMIGDAVENIAGEKVELSVLMGSGVDPHLYKATKGDIDRLDAADVIFYNGLNLEAKMAEIIGKMGRSKVTSPIGEVIDTSLLLLSEKYIGHPDPHIWFDLSLWNTAVAEITNVLLEFDSTHAEFYRANGAAYLDSIDALHQWVSERIWEIPEDQRVLITAHDAFGYFGDAYHIEVRGLQGISTVTEAGLHDVTAMVDYISERKIKAVFVESSVPRKAIEAVVEGCQSKGHDVVVGGELYSDAMGQAGTVEGTYFGMVRHNVNTIVNALK
jgi:manganese/zinc/iron transport system substrate-binding protein